MIVHFLCYHSSVEYQPIASVYMCVNNGWLQLYYLMLYSEVLVSNYIIYLRQSYKCKYYIAACSYIRNILSYEESYWSYDTWLVSCMTGFKIFSHQMTQEAILVHDCVQNFWSRLCIHIGVLLPETPLAFPSACVIVRI